MWATYWDSLQEVGGRKVLLALVGLGLVMGVLFHFPVAFAAINGVDIIYYGRLNMGPWPFAVPTLLGQVSNMSGMIWFMLMIIAGCPLFVLILERGWRELMFSTGTRRWRIFLGRYLAITTLFLFLVVMCNTLVAVRLWWQTGIPAWSVAGAILIQTFSFASLLAIGALASLNPEGGVALPIIASFGAWGLSAALLGRQAWYDEYITSEAARLAIDWLYYILPKGVELNSAAMAFIQSSAIPSSWPFWTTGLFTLATLTLTLWLLERKSF